MPYSSNRTAFIAASGLSVHCPTDTTNPGPRPVMPAALGRAAHRDRRSAGVREEDGPAGSTGRLSDGNLREELVFHLTYAIIGLAGL